MKIKSRTPAFAELSPSPLHFRRTRRPDQSADAVAGWPKKAEKKSEKSEKWFFVIFQLEPSAAQLVPTKTRSGVFSVFSRNSRGYTGGGLRLRTHLLILI